MSSSTCIHCLIFIFVSSVNMYKFIFVAFVYSNRKNFTTVKIPSFFLPTKTPRPTISYCFHTREVRMNTKLRGNHTLTRTHTSRPYVNYEKSRHACVFFDSVFSYIFFFLIFCALVVCVAIQFSRSSR